MIVKLIDMLRNNLPLVKKLSLVFLASAVVFDIFVHRHHEHFFGDKILGFWSIFGFIGCVLMIKICKGIAHLWLTKQEDYYE